MNCRLQLDITMTHLYQLAAELGSVLFSQHHLLVTAESCTGGGIASAVTDIPGSSAWFDCGFVTYSNLSKTQSLAVLPELITQHGAVSLEVAAAMAQGALAASCGTLAIATTGIAGPSGATLGKPVGTVCFGLACLNYLHTEKQHFEGNRQMIRHQSILHALSMLLDFLRLPPDKAA